MGNAKKERGKDISAGGGVVLSHLTDPILSEQVNQQIDNKRGEQGEAIHENRH